MNDEIWKQKLLVPTIKRTLLERTLTLSIVWNARANAIGGGRGERSESELKRFLSLDDNNIDIWNIWPAKLLSGSLNNYLLDLKNNSVSYAVQLF